MSPNNIIKPFDSKNQKQVFDIFYAHFSEQIENDNCFLLTDVGQKITKTLKENGFAGAKAGVFRACPEYFIYGYDIDKHTDTYMADALAVVGHEIPTRFVSREDFQKLESNNVEKRLKKQFRYNEVPVRDVEAFLKKQSIAYTDIHELIHEFAPAMEFKMLSHGEGHPTEEFLVIHKPLPIPENIKNRIIWTVKENFSGKHIVRNSELGTAFRKLDVHFQNYKYLDLTAFIRHFSDIFSIISIKKNEKNQVDIMVRILHDNLKDIPLPKLDIDPFKKQKEVAKKEKVPTADEFFRNSIFEAYQNNAYESLLEKVYISYGMNHLDDTAIWTAYINAFLKSGAFPKVSEYTLNPWEKAVFPMDFAQMKLFMEEKDQMTSFGFTEEEIQGVAALMNQEQSKASNISALAARMKIFLPQNSLLPEILFSIGLLQNEKTVRESAVRNLSAHYLATNCQEKLLALWKKHHTDLSAKSVAKLFRNCMEHSHPEVILPLGEMLPQTITSHAMVLIHLRMASYLEASPQDMSVTETMLLKELFSFQETERVTCLTELVRVILSKKQYWILASLFGAVLTLFPRRKADELLRQLCPMLIPHQEALLQFLTENFAPSQMKLCAFWEFLALQYDTFSQWETKRMEVITYYQEEITSAAQPEDALQTAETALAIFPEEASFLDTQIRLLEKKYADINQEKAYKNILIELSQKKNYLAVIGLSKSEKLARYQDDIWYRELLLTAYREQLMLSGAIQLQMNLLERISQQHSRYFPYIQALCEDLYDYFYRMKKSDLPEGAVLNKVIEYTENFLTQQEDIHYNQVCVLLKLLLLKEQYLSAAFFYALIHSSNTASEEMKTAITSEQSTLAKHLPTISEEELKEIDSMFQYVITTFSMREIDRIFNIGRHVVLLDQFETTCSAYRVDRHLWKANFSLTKLLISSPNYGEAWRIYADETKDIAHVNYVALFMLVYRCGNLSWPLNRCILALEQSVQEAMPQNLLELSYALLTKKNCPQSYLIPFLVYVKRHNSFFQCPQELSTRFFEFTRLHSEYSPLTVEILKQTQSLDLFFRHYLTQKHTVNEEAVMSLGIDFLLPMVLHYIKETDGFTKEQNDGLSLLLDFAKANAVSSKQKTATLWVEEMLEKRRTERIESDYFRISFQLLQYYPVMDRSDFSKYENSLPLENYCNLLDRWLKINPNFNRARALYVYYTSMPICKNEQERQLQFRYLSNAVTKMYEHSNPAYTVQDNLLRTGKSMLSLYFLNNFYHDSHIQTTVPELMEMFENRLNHAELIQLANALICLWKANLPHDFRDYLVMCGITNYWDQFLMDLTAPDFDRSILSHEAVLQYTALLETHKLNRRVLQMLIFAKIAEYNASCETTNPIYITHEEFPCFQKMAENSEINKHFFESLADISNLSGKGLNTIVRSFIAMPQEDLQELLPRAEHLIVDKRIHPMLSALLTNISHSLANTLVELFFELHTTEYIIKTLLDLFQNEAQEQSDDMLKLLKNPVFVKNTGEFFSAYLLAMYYYVQSDFELAEKTMPSSELCPTEHKGTFHKIQDAIANRIPLAELNFMHNTTMPKLSFVEAAVPAPGEQYSDLLISFESGNRTNNEKTLIQLAKKIYYFMSEAKDFADYPRLVMRWGFLEIATSHNYSHRLALLQELADHSHLMEQPQVFQSDFLEAFEEFFLSYSERAILQDFDKIQTVGQQIANLYRNKEISTILSLIQPISEDFKKPSKEFHVTLSQLLNEGTLLRNHHPGNQLIQKCYDVISSYKILLENKGRLEIQILNEDGFTSGSVFYTVKNIGSYPINNLRVVVSIQKNDENLKYAAKEIAGLHRGQTLAEEVELEDFFLLVPPEETIQVCVDISYNCQEHEALTLHKECTLTSKTEDYEYIHRACRDFPIYRMELDNIYTTVRNRNLVMLYGTNGTGKTSLLKLLRDRFALENTDTSQVFTVLLTDNEDDRPTREILKDIMTSFCYYDGANTDTTSVYTQLNTFLKYSTVPEEKQQRILSEYREYISCDAENGPFTFSGLIDQLKNLNNKFKEFKAYLGLDFKFCLLWDAFEKVISSKKVSPEEMNFKSLIDTFKGEESQIRIVFTGSNKLLEVAEVKDDADPWNIMFRDVSGDASIKVGNLHPKDFETIIADPNLLNEGELHFSKAALDYLYQYTNGHSWYSRMFVNQALEILNNRRVNRRCIYPSDLKIASSDRVTANNEQLLAKNLTAQIFQDITNDFGVISVGFTLANMVSDGNHAVPAAELQNTASSNYHDLTAEQFQRAVEVLKARDFITEELDKYQKLNYRFTSVLYQQHFLNREDQLANISYEKFSLDELIYEIQNHSYKNLEEVERLAEALSVVTKNVTIHIDRQYNDNATDQSIGTQNNIQINAQNIATTFNAILTAEGSDLQELFSSLPMASAFLDQTKKDQLQALYSNLEAKETEPINIFDVEATKQQQQEQEAIQEQIAEIIEPAINEMHTTYKNAMVMTDDTPDQFYPWEILGFSSRAEYELLTTKLEPEFVADLYFAAKLDHLFKSMEDDTVTKNQTDFSPVSIMYCKLIEKMLKHYHTDIYADKLKSASTQNSIRDAETKTDKLVLFGDLADDSVFSQQDLANIRNKIMIGAFLWPINPRFDNRENRAILSDNDMDIGRRWELHGTALNDISRTRNDSAHGSSNKRITQKRLSDLKNWLFERKELQNIVELSWAHRDGKDILDKIREEDKKLLELLKTKN